MSRNTICGAQHLPDLRVSPPAVRELITKAGQVRIQLGDDRLRDGPARLVVTARGSGCSENGDVRNHRGYMSISPA